MRAGFLAGILLLAGGYTWIAFAELALLSSAGRLGPGFFPRIVGGALVVLCAWSLATELRQRDRERHTAMQEVVEDDCRDERADEADEKRRAIEREEQSHAGDEQGDGGKQRLPRRNATRRKRAPRPLRAIGREIEEIVGDEPHEVEPAQSGGAVHDDEQVPELDRPRHRRAGTFPYRERKRRQPTLRRESKPRPEDRVARDRRQVRDPKEFEPGAASCGDRHRRQRSGPTVRRAARGSREGPIVRSGSG